MAASASLRLLPIGVLTPSSSPYTKPKIRMYPTNDDFAASLFSRGNVGAKGRSGGRTRIMASAAAARSFQETEVGEDFSDGYDSWYPKKDPLEARRAGILLHPTSLQGLHGIGDLGDEAIRFVDWLYSAGCTIWQVLLYSPLYCFVFRDSLLIVTFHNIVLEHILFILSWQVLPLVPPGRKSNEDGSPYAGQVTECAFSSYPMRTLMLLTLILILLPT